MTPVYFFIQTNVHDTIACLCQTNSKLEQHGLPSFVASSPTTWNLLPMIMTHDPFCSQLNLEVVF